MKNMFLQPAKDLVSDIYKRYERWSGHTQSSGFQGVWQTAYRSYYGDYFDGKNPGLKSGGEQGEYTLLAINHARNIIQHILNMTTQNKIVFDTLAENSDVKSKNATKNGNAILDYYYYEIGGAAQVKSALEMSLIFGTGYLLGRWEPNNRIVGMDGAEKPVYQGAPRFQYLSPYDVLLDPTKDDFRKQDWVVTREIVNKWDLAAIYDDKKEEIEGLPRIADLQYFAPNWQHDDENVFLYELYHKSTPKLPSGRYIKFCDGGVVLSDGPNPYVTRTCAGMPVFEMKPNKKFGGAYGYSVLFDLLPVQDALNLLHSTIISNQKSFGVQNIAVPRDAGVNPSEVFGALNMLEYDAVEGVPGGGKPEALMLCATPTEVFNYSKELVLAMEQISGINSAARGQPGSSLTSGTAIALVATSANTFNNSTESEYTRVIEESAGFLIGILQQFLTEEEVIAISGKNNTYSVKGFVGADLGPIKRVKVQMGNPLSKSLSGRLEIANNLLMNQMIKNPQEYLEVLQYGTLTPILESELGQSYYVKEENERMSEGQPVQMIQLDNHLLHINEHLLLTFRPEVRDNESILPLVLEHIQEHIDALEDMAINNPMILSLALQQPLMLPQANPQAMNQPQPPGGPAPEGGMPAAPAEGGPSPEGAMEQTAEKGEAMAATQQAKAAQGVS